MLKTKSLTNQEYGLGWTHEEIITPLVGRQILSYKDLPLAVYQVQTKFRDEKRAKSGLLRGREFRMKDLYSFHLSETNLDEYYEQVKTAYFKIFKQVGLEKRTYLTLAGGGAFSKFSHEFQAVSSVGEDLIHLCRQCSIAINQEIIKEQTVCPDCGGQDFEKLTAIEAGNIFKLKTRFSDSFNLKVKDKTGQEKSIFMGCYGIGSSRLMGAIAEILSDEQGLVWPQTVAPFKYHLLVLTKEKLDFAKQIYSQLGEDNVLLDDRFHLSNGQRLTDADLLGLPIRLVVSQKAGEKIEVKNRTEDETKLVSMQAIK